MKLKVGDEVAVGAEFTSIGINYSPERWLEIYVMCYDYSFRYGITRYVELLGNFKINGVNVGVIVDISRMIEWGKKR